MAVPIPLGQSGSCSAGGNRLDVVLQLRRPKYGIGRNHPKTAARHGCIALLLLSTVKNGGITTPSHALINRGRQAVLGTCNRRGVASLPPAQTVVRLLNDEQICLAYCPRAKAGLIHGDYCI